MPERTHLSQEDEALRRAITDETSGRAQHLTASTRQLLGDLANKLSGYRPDAPMLEATRLAQALVVAERKHGPTEAAFAAERHLLDVAPPVRDGQTRGEYAALLLLIAEGVTQ
ncbi:hypothetical protein [Streptomyces sp. NPDC059015]|uniref:hypothetical protein n=1 Tax=unclassified Streptomyces TaxID=2593676 RepID=UPI0036A8D583